MAGRDRCCGEQEAIISIPQMVKSWHHACNLRQLLRTQDNLEWGSQMSACLKKIRRTLDLDGTYTLELVFYSNNNLYHLCSFI